MGPPPMHDSEVEVPVEVVCRLLADQCPALADRPLREGPSTGTVNALFRLGDDLCVRIPRRADGVASLEKELTWLARLAPALPVELPEPVFAGRPGPGCPVPWAVLRWIDGEVPVPDLLSDETGLAGDLATLIAAFRRIDPAGGPSSGRRPPAELDAVTRTALSELVPGDGVDRDAATAAWERALEAPGWDGAPVWRHGDLLAPNLLLRDGRLAAVLDLGSAGVGDPAHDLLPAWTVLGPTGRTAFRERLDVDDGTWSRARAVALHQALLIVPYYRTSNPGFAALARRTIREIVTDAAL